MRQHIIRIFVSSTFDDMKIERNILRDKVFPQLSEDCKNSGWILEYVDLRWGISKNASESHSTMRICLEELSRSQKLSPKPNFLILYGEHSGWHPAPEVLSVDVFEKLINVAETETEKQKLKDGYHKDTNTIPAHYWLQKCADEEAILKILSRAHKIYSSNREIERLMASATMQEIYAGALEVDNAEDHVIAYVRTFSNPPDVDLGVFRDVDYEEWKSNLKKIESKIVSTNRIEANLDYENYEAHCYDNDICTELYNKLKLIIEKEIESFSQQKELEIDLETNEEFTRTAAEQFEGREETIDALLQEITNNPTVLLNGESGIGKTSLMAKLASIQMAHDNKVVYAFIGITPNLTRGDYMAKVIAVQLSEYCELQDVYEPEDLYQLLSDVSPSQPTYIFIDSLDSLQIGDVFRNMSWLPGKMHDNMHIICSQIPSNDISYYPYVKVFNVPKLSAPDSICILCSDLAKNNRCITQEQRKVVERMFEKGESTPLYAKLLAHIVMQLHSEMTFEIDPDVNHFTTKYLWRRIIRMLITNSFHDKRLVTLYLRALSLTFYGISDEELSSYIASDDLYYDRLLEDCFHELPQNSGRCVPQIIISRLKSDLDNLLAISRVEDKLVYRWRHSLLAKLTIEHLLESDFKDCEKNIALAKMRSALCNTFMQQMHEGNVHAVYELQHLQTFTNDYFNLFTNFEYLSKRISNTLTDKLGYIYHSIKFHNEKDNTNWNEIKNFEVEASRYYDKNFDAFDYLLKFAFQYSPHSYLGCTLRAKYAEQIRGWSENLLYREESAHDALKPIFKPSIHPCAICDDGCTAYGVKDGKIWKIDLIKNTQSEVRFKNLGNVISMKCVGNDARYWAVLSNRRFIMIYDRQANKILYTVSLKDYIMDGWDPLNFLLPQNTDGYAYFISYCDSIRLAFQYQDGNIEVWENGKNILTLQEPNSCHGRLASISGNGKYLYMYIWDSDQYANVSHELGKHSNEIKHGVTRFNIDSFTSKNYWLPGDFFHCINNMASSEDGSILVFSEGGFTACARFVDGENSIRFDNAHNHRLDLNHNIYAISPDGKNAYSYGETDGTIISYDTQDMIPRFLLRGNMYHMYNAIFSHSKRFAFIFASGWIKSLLSPNWYIMDTENNFYVLSRLIRSGIYSMDIWENHLLFSVGGDPVTDSRSTVYHMNINTRKITTLDIPNDINVGGPSNNISFSRDGHTVLLTRRDTIYVFNDFKYVTHYKVNIATKGLDKNDCSVRCGYIYSTDEVYKSIYEQYDAPIAEFIYLSDYLKLRQMPIVPYKGLGYYLRKKENGVLIYPSQVNPGFAYYFRGEFGDFIRK